MFNTSKIITSILLPAALLGAATGVAACGDGGVDRAKLDSVKAQGQAIQKDAASAQTDIAAITADMKSGKISAEEGQKKIDAITSKITDKAKAASSTAIDAVKNNSHLSDADKKQLADAQAQLK